MPRYYFHLRSKDRLVWAKEGLVAELDGSLLDEGRDE